MAGNSRRPRWPAKRLVWSGRAVAMLLLSGLLSTGLTGCVTETRYPQRSFDAEQAAKARIALGLHYLESGDRVNARLNLERARQHAPELPEVHNARAHFFRVVKEPELAEAAYLEALEYAPGDPRTLNNYGTFLCVSGRFAEADAGFVRVINHPGYIHTADVLENAGLCALRGNRPELASEYLSQMLQYAPERAGSLKQKITAEQLPPEQLAELINHLSLQGSLQ